MQKPRKNSRVLSLRPSKELLAQIDDYRRKQPIIPTQTEALNVLVDLGYGVWKSQQGVKP